MKEIKQILKLYLLTVVLIVISCSKDNDEYKLYWYPTVIGDYKLKIPAALPFTVDSIKYIEAKYPDSINLVEYFILKDSVNIPNILIAGKQYSTGRIMQDSIMRKDINWEWVIKGGCVPDPNFDVLLKKEIKVLKKSDRYIRAYVSFNDEKEKTLKANLQIRFDEINFSFYIKLYEGDKSYIEILKDIDLIEKLAVIKAD